MNSILDLPDELIIRVIINTDYDTLINFCKTNKRFREICKDRLFWDEKLYNDYRIKVREFNKVTSKEYTSVKLYEELYSNGIRKGEAFGYYPVYYEKINRISFSDYNKEYILFDWVFLRPADSYIDLIKKVLSIIPPKSGVSLNNLLIRLMKENTPNIDSEIKRILLKDMNIILRKLLKIFWYG